MADEIKKENEEQKDFLLEEKNADFDLAKQKARNLKIKDLLKLSVRAFRVRPLRTFLTVLGMSVGIGTVFFLISLGYGLQYILIGKLAPTEDSLVSLQASYPEQGSMAISPLIISDAEKLPGAQEISPVAEDAGVVNYNGYNGDLIVKIVDDKYDRLSGFVANYVTPGIKFGSGAVISNTALRLLGLPENQDSLGKMITVNAVYEIPAPASSGASGQNNPTEKTVSTKNSVPIVGIVTDDTESPYVYIPVNLMSEAPPSYDLFFIKAKSDSTLEQLRSDLVKQGFIISARIDTVRQARRITDIITIVLGVFGVAALIVSSIGMFNTMLISFMERIFEVGIMKSIGATRYDILGLFLMESFLMGLLGGLGGIAIGFIGGTLVNLGMNILARYLGGNPISLFIYSGQFMIFILILSGVVGLLSGYWPARRAAKLSAREAFLRK